jgi:hypothetical protein
MEQVTWNAVNTAKIKHCQHILLAMYNTNWATCYNIHILYIYIYEAESKSEVNLPVEVLQPMHCKTQNLVAVSATTY